MFQLNENLNKFKSKEYQLLTAVFPVSTRSLLTSAIDLWTTTIIMGRYMQMPYYQWKLWTLEEKNVIKRMGDHMGMLWLRTPGLGKPSMVFNVHNFHRHGFFWTEIMSGRLLNYSTEGPENCYGRCGRSGMANFYGSGSGKIPLYKTLPKVMCGGHNHKTFVRIKSKKTKRTNDTLVYNRSGEFFLIIQCYRKDGDKHPSFFDAKKLVLEEVFWNVPIRRNFGKKKDVFASINVSKMGIFKYLGEFEETLRIERNEIEGSAALNFTPGGEKYVVSISSQLLRNN